MLPQELQKQILDLFGQVYEKGRADAVNHILKAANDTAPRSGAPAYYASARMNSSSSSPYKTGVGTKEGTVSFKVKNYVLHNQGQTSSDIRMALQRMEPNTKGKAVRSALGRLRDDNILVQRDNRWYAKGVS